MSTKKELNIEELIQQALLKDRAEQDLLREQRESNYIKLGARVVLKESRLGAPKMDKDKLKQLTDGDGVALCYPTKYSVTLQFFGGELKTEVSQDKYDLLQETKTYFCEGYLGLVKDFGQETMKPIITKYTEV